MRSLLLLAMLAALCASCADEPAQDATPAEPAWFSSRPENAHAYSDKTLARFRKLVEGEAWRDAAWNAQGTLEAVHEKTGLTFVLIPAGEFLMGSEDGEKYERPVHEVTVPAFLLCRTECTQKAWARGGGTNSPKFKGDYLPVENVHWRDCHAWCEELGLRLPSEAEWEYACRGWTTTRYWSGDEESDLDRVGWCDENSGGQTHAVGEKPANPLGLHDMHGNVWEWCEDTSIDSHEGAPADGTARVIESAEYRVFRGGSWSGSARAARSACRGWLRPGLRVSFLGFRPAADLPDN
jgi:formylglycine-generating enzyme required for sulfatase activity